MLSKDGKRRETSWNEKDRKVLKDVESYCSDLRQGLATNNLKTQMLRSILLLFSRSFRIALLGLGICIEVAHVIDPVLQAGATAGSKGYQVQSSLSGRSNSHSVEKTCGGAFFWIEYRVNCTWSCGILQHLNCCHLARMISPLLSLAKFGKDGGARDGWGVRGCCLFTSCLTYGLSFHTPRRVSEWGSISAHTWPDEAITQRFACLQGLQIETWCPHPISRGCSERVAWRLKG